MTKTYIAPPEKVLWRGASGDFLPQARKWHETFRMHAPLGPASRVLEIGCGSGRMALPFQSYFTTGHYVGVDISRDAIEWARRSLGDDRLRFEHIDVANEWYRPGEGQPVGRLPFDDDAFDFVYLTSVFSHLRAMESVAYLREISRLLAPGGTVFSTWFLLDDFSRTNIRRGLARFSFQHETAPATWDEDPARIGKATAVDMATALAGHYTHGLAPTLVRGAWSFHPGTNRGEAARAEFPTARHSQDILVGRFIHEAA